MQKYSEIHTVRISKIQKETLRKLKQRGYNVNQFIRIAIAEKIKRDYADLQVKEEEPKIPF